MSQESSNPFNHVSRVISETSFVERFLSHFGAFCIGGAIAIGVYSDEVNDAVCSTSRILESGAVFTADCYYVAKLSTRMQLGLAGLALVLLLASELVSRGRHASRRG